MKTLFFLKAKCVNTNRDFYIRYDFAADDRWVNTYGVTELPSGGNISSAGMEIDYSTVRNGPQYKCPHCGNREFIKCGCGGYTCHIGGGVTAAKCAHCGAEGEISGSISSVETKNTGIGQ